MEENHHKPTYSLVSPKNKNQSTEVDWFSDKTIGNSITKPIMAQQYQH